MRVTGLTALWGRGKLTGVAPDKVSCFGKQSCRTEAPTVGAGAADASPAVLPELDGLLQTLGCSGVARTPSIL